MVKVFSVLGFEKHREKGDHIIMTKAGIKRPIVIPKYKSIGNDIIKANIKTAGITRDEFISILHGEKRMIFHSYNEERQK